MFKKSLEIIKKTNKCNKNSSRTYYVKEVFERVKNKFKNGSRHINVWPVTRDTPNPSTNHLPVHINQEIKKRIKQKTRTQQYIQLNTEQKISNSQTLIGSFVFRSKPIYREDQPTYITITDAMIILTVVP